MVMAPDNFSRLRSLGTMIHLDADLDVLRERIDNGGVRPLAASGPDTWVELYAHRRPVYEKIPHRVDTSRRSAQETACDIAESVRSDGSILHLRVDTRPLPGRLPTIENTRLCRVVSRRGAAGELATWLERIDLVRPDETSRLFLLTPEHIADMHLKKLVDPLAGRSIAWDQIHIDDGDAHKTLDQATHVLERLAASGATRDSVIVTLGGGVTGDLGGFVASLYMRGIPWINVPTTLLAQVDAGIGGKTGVNTEVAKNLIGAFHHPLVVLCDPDVLATLPSREIAGGMAEVIKTAMIGDSELFARLVTAARRGDDFGPELLEECVRVCARVKGRIVDEDPYERGLRRVLNLGHTLGHALETSLGYAGLRHGEAVALGLLAALRVSIGQGEAAPEYLNSVRELLEWCGLPVELPAVDDQAVRNALRLDKKNLRGTLRFVLPIAPGQVKIERIDVDDIILAMRD
jgi:3-dehydroquinate synthase